jgi:hypothetical protein
MWSESLERGPELKLYITAIHESNKYIAELFLWSLLKYRHLKTIFNCSLPENKHYQQNCCSSC